MTSKRETVLAALFALLKTGAVEVLRNEVYPADIPATGLMILHDGVPGQPDITLSPSTWYYQHQAELEVFAEGGTDLDTAFDAIVSALGILIATDRTLDGLCDWVEAEAPAPTNLPLEGAPSIKAASVTIVLHYSTTDPLN